MTFNRNAKRSRAVTRSRNVPNANAVSTLPAELLGKIFVEARQSYWESLERDGLNAVGLDIWLYAVCASNFELGEDHGRTPDVCLITSARAR
ncbi:hypothetical protein ONZ45_g11852 [Pleurotus djamor]|nr:hypothetical protein ONZ45_g11852 [Pleurotus djamor]